MNAQKTQPLHSANTKRFGRIHAADIRNSKRLQRVYRLLEDGRWYSTRAIQRLANVCNPNTAKAELIANGCKVECEQRGKRFFYRMTKGLDFMKQSDQEAA